MIALRTTTTTQLLQSLLDPASQEVWNELDGRYRPIILGVCRRIGLSDPDAADVAQETLTRFMQGYRDGQYNRHRGKLRSWMLGIMRHVVANRLHSMEGQRQWRGASALDLLSDSRELTEVWDTERRAAILACAMDELHTATRLGEQSIQCFQMVAIQRLSPDDVAKQLGVTRHDVYVAKHRVIEHLREIVCDVEARFDAEK